MGQAHYDAMDANYQRKGRNQQRFGLSLEGASVAVLASALLIPSFGEFILDNNVKDGVLVSTVITALAGYSIVRHGTSLRRFFGEPDAR